MVTVRTHKDEEVEIKFGLGELTKIDDELGFEVEKIRMGEGLEMLVPKLKTGNLIAISKIIKCTLPTKKVPKKEEEIEQILINVIEDYGSLQAFGEKCIKKLKDNLLTQDLVQDEE